MSGVPVPPWDFKTTMRPLPVLLSIPHGGTKMPPELEGRVCIEPVDLFDDSDAFTRGIFDLGDRAAAVLYASIARAFVDLNRSTEDIPPRNPDGLIKSMTCYGKPIYIKGKEPGPALMRKLVSRYYHPYHRKIREIIKNNKNREILLALDCHSMAVTAPAVAPDTGEQRPLICLGNVHGQSCPAEIVGRLAECFCSAFSIDEDDIAINRPFSGGYITRTYGCDSGSESCIPWVQVELNRSFYLRAPWFDRSSLRIDHGRLEELNAMFARTLELFFKTGVSFQ
jgi:formiminoglutamase